MLDNQQKLQSVVMGQMPGVPKQNYSAPPPQQPNIEFMDTSSFSGYSQQSHPNQPYVQPVGGSWDYGSIGAGGTQSFDNEPPLLEELGIDFQKICDRTVSVLNPFKKVSSDMLTSRTQDGQTVADSDMAGPVLIALLLGASMLLRGKVHFGYIYGVGGVGCVSLWAVMTLMCHKGIDIWQTASILGYCLLPMVLLAFLSLFFAATGPIMVLLTALVVGWSTWRSSDMFVLSMDGLVERALVAYPIGLFYMCFALLSIF